MRRLLLRTASMAVVAEVDVVRSGACQAVCSRIRVAGAIRRGGRGLLLPSLRRGCCSVDEAGGSLGGPRHAHAGLVV